MLIQPNEVLTQRCPDVKEFSNYIKSVQDVIEPYNTGNKSLGNGYIVIAPEELCIKEQLQFFGIRDDHLEQ